MAKLLICKYVVQHIFYPRGKGRSDGERNIHYYKYTREHVLLATSYELPATSYELRATSYELPNTVGTVGAEHFPPVGIHGDHDGGKDCGVRCGFRVQDIAPLQVIYSCWCLANGLFTGCKWADYDC